MHLNSYIGFVNQYNHINHLLEDSMLEVTAAATKKLSDYFRGKKASPVRIFLNQGG